MGGDVHPRTLTVGPEKYCHVRLSVSGFNSRVCIWHVKSTLFVINLLFYATEYIILHHVLCCKPDITVKKVIL